MFRKTTGSILCPSCRRITSADAEACYYCGRRRPGLWGFAPALQAVGGVLGVTPLIAWSCVVLYVLSLLLDPIAALRPRSPFDLLAPSGWALDRLGMTGAFAWAAGHWWTLITAIYLHGSLLHILFNVLWIRQLGPAVQELYGSARLAVIFTVAGVAGFALSNALGIGATIGASGAIFGLLGAMVAYGRQRGGVFGSLVLRQYGQWALVLFVFGFFMAGVNNLAHAGGFVGGLVAGLTLSNLERRPEGRADQLLATATVAITILAFAIAVWRGFATS
jgi:rhomboid protease GluP